MIKIEIVLIILFIHWVADFLCQNDWMALNKSKQWDALFTHTSVYTCAWIPFCLYYGNAHFSWIFLLSTLVLHTTTDFFTSRINSRLWKAGKNHWFFVSIGFDQFLHFTQLLLTYYLLTK